MPRSAAASGPVRASAPWQVVHDQHIGLNFLIVLEITFARRAMISWLETSSTGLTTR